MKEDPGTDGLTNSERYAMALKYRMTVMAPLSEFEIEAAKKWIEAKRAQGYEKD
jgi:hypothetical protein